MSTAALEVLDMLSRRTIDVDEAIRLLKAIRNNTGRLIGAAVPAGAVGGDDILMELVGSSPRPQFGYGNIIMR